jgi:hypothetical protein
MDRNLILVSHSLSASGLSKIVINSDARIWGSEESMKLALLNSSEERNKWLNHHNSSDKANKLSSQAIKKRKFYGLYHCVSSILTQDNFREELDNNLSISLAKDKHYMICGLRDDILNLVLRANAGIFTELGSDIIPRIVSLTETKYLLRLRLISKAFYFLVRDELKRRWNNSKEEDQRDTLALQKPYLLFWRDEELRDLIPNPIRYLLHVEVDKSMKLLYNYPLQLIHQDVLIFLLLKFVNIFSKNRASSKKHLKYGRRVALHLRDAYIRDHPNKIPSDEFLGLLIIFGSDCVRGINNKLADAIKKIEEKKKLTWSKDVGSEHIMKAIRSYCALNNLSSDVIFRKFPGGNILGGKYTIPKSYMMTQLNFCYHSSDVTIVQMLAYPNLDLLNDPPYAGFLISLLNNHSITHIIKYLPLPTEEYDGSTILETSTPQQLQMLGKWIRYFPKDIIEEVWMGCSVISKDLIMETKKVLSEGEFHKLAIRRLGRDLSGMIGVCTCARYNLDMVLYYVFNVKTTPKFTSENYRIITEQIKHKYQS